MILCAGFARKWGISCFARVHVGALSIWSVLVSRYGNNLHVNVSICCDLNMGVCVVQVDCGSLSLYESCYVLYTTVKPTTASCFASWPLVQSKPCIRPVTLGRWYPRGNSCAARASTTCTHASHASPRKAWSSALATVASSITQLYVLLCYTAVFQRTEQS
jgi:hypothetical protein